jgi:hypothetical protein
VLILDDVHELLGKKKLRMPFPHIQPFTPNEQAAHPYIRPGTCRLQGLKNDSYPVSNGVYRLNLPHPTLKPGFHP